MRITAFSVTLLCIFLLLTACDDNLLRPADYVPDNANRQPLFHRSLLMDESGNYYTGYRNFHIRPDRVSLEWDSSTDDNFLYYQLYRGNDLIKEIYDPTVSSYTDSLLLSGRYYHYTIATRVRTGLSKTDTLTVKTASNLAPLVSYRVNSNFDVIIQWKDQSDIPGQFKIFKDNVFISEVNEHLPTDYNYVYTYTDNNTQQYQNHTYFIQKVGPQDSSLPSSPLSVYVDYIMTSPYLNSLHQVSGTTNVALDWTEDCSGETGFKIYRREENEANFTLIKTINQSNQTQYIDTDSLTIGNTYFYYVTAIDTDNEPPYETPPSNIRFITIKEHLSVEWKIALKDSYGDGWNGGFLFIYINDNLVYDYLTLDDGYGPQYTTFTVTDGDQIFIDYFPGNWPSENYYAVIDQNNNIVAESGGTWDNPGVSVPNDMTITVNLGGGKIGANAITKLGGLK